MNIKGVGNLRAIEMYNKNSNKREVKENKEVLKDRIEISNEAKVLSNYSIDKNDYDKSQKIEDIKFRIQNGTYNIDSKLTAKSILDAMREK